MIKNIMHYNLFPILLYSSYLDRDITEDEKNLVKRKSEETVNNTFNLSTKDKNVLKNNLGFNNLKLFIELNLKNYVDTIICPKYDLEIYITDSWLNFNNKEESHHIHLHKNSFLSGVFYFNTIKNDIIRFHNILNNDFFQFEQKHRHIYNSETWDFPVNIGQLILFPSKVIHSVPKNTENKTRISLAFNTFVKGTIASDPTYSELRL